MKKIAKLSPVPLAFGAYVLSLFGFVQMAFFVYSLALDTGVGASVGLGLGMAAAFVLAGIGFHVQGLQSDGVIGGAFLDVSVAGQHEKQQQIVHQLRLAESAGAAPRVLSAA